jgi:hypothetical protein
MGYKRTKHTVYVVFWERDNLFKIGYSAAQRWKPFVARGAEVLALKEFPSYGEASAFESICHRIARQVMPIAFASAGEADRFLGGGGGGYTECYQMLDAMHPHHASALLTAHATALLTVDAEEKRRDQSRTLTKKQLTLSSYLTAE